MDNFVKREVKKPKTRLESSDDEEAENDGDAEIEEVSTGPSKQLANKDQGKTHEKPMRTINRKAVIIDSDDDEEDEPLKSESESSWATSE